MSRLADVMEFYRLIGELADKVNQTRLLRDCSGRDRWPQRGVYFFFEDGEHRHQSGDRHRVVRVGTHAVSKGSRTSLWNRLSQHRGTNAGTGNHRGSVFRLWIGDALARKDTGLKVDTWLDKNAGFAVREAEHALERRVSEYIGNMPFVWLEVDDTPGKGSMRAYIERNAIALLSNYGADEPIDPPSEEWLGRHSSSREIRCSGLWNCRHVDENYDSQFLHILERYINGQPWR